MKTPMPEPAIPRSQLLATSQGVFGMLFTEEQLRAAMVAAYNEAIEEAADLCEYEFEDVPLTVVADLIRKLKGTKP